MAELQNPQILAETVNLPLAGWKRTELPPTHCSMTPFNTASADSATRLPTDGRFKTSARKPYFFKISYNTPNPSVGL